jgi:hypothetical protein
MLTLGREPIQFVSEEYGHHALTRSATSGCGKQPPFCNIHVVRKLASQMPQKINDL